MKFNVQRVLTPAYLTSVALIVIGIVLGLAWYPVAAWVFALSGLVLNAMAVAVTAINDSPRTRAPVGRRVPSLPGRRPRDDGAAGRGRNVAGTRQDVEPEAETQATPVVRAAGSSTLKPRR